MEFQFFSTTLNKTVWNRKWKKQNKKQKKKKTFIFVLIVVSQFAYVALFLLLLNVVCFCFLHLWFFFYDCCCVRFTYEQLILYVVIRKHWDHTNTQITTQATKTQESSFFSTSRLFSHQFFCFGMSIPCAIERVFGFECCMDKFFCWMD